MTPTTAHGDVFLLDPDQLGALCAYLSNEGFTPSPPMADGELGRMEFGAEVVVLHSDGKVAARGDDAGRAGRRLLWLCE